jgi:hypothetical protein
VIASPQIISPDDKYMVVKAISMGGPAVRTELNHVRVSLRQGKPEQWTTISDFRKEPAASFLPERSCASPLRPKNLVPTGADGYSEEELKIRKLQ